MGKAKFNRGDLVQLSSGGPIMAVKAVNDYADEISYRCQWFAGKKLEDGDFPEESLNKGEVHGEADRMKNPD
jgi:uncharacterized protein YodC (DUF2158 family)